MADIKKLTAQQVAEAIGRALKKQTGAEVEAVGFGPGFDEADDENTGTETKKKFMQAKKEGTMYFQSGITKKEVTGPMGEATMTKILALMHSDFNAYTRTNLMTEGGREMLDAVADLIKAHDKFMNAGQPAMASGVARSIEFLLEGVSAVLACDGNHNEAFAELKKLRSGEKPCDDSGKESIQ